MVNFSTELVMAFDMVILFTEAIIILVVVWVEKESANVPLIILNPK